MVSRTVHREKIQLLGKMRRLVLVTRNNTYLLRSLNIMCDRKCSPSPLPHWLLSLCPGPGQSCRCGVSGRPGPAAVSVLQPCSRQGSGAVGASLSAVCRPGQLRCSWIGGGGVPSRPLWGQWSGQGASLTALAFPVAQLCLEARLSLD